MRATEALMGKDYKGNQTDNGGLDLSIGGQNGANLSLGLKNADGTTAAAWVNDVPYITQQVIPFLMEVPKGFSLFANAAKLTRHLKELIEVRSTTISGITFNTTVEREDATIGGSGQTLGEVTNTVRAKIEPVHEWRDIQGLAIHQFWEFYIQYLLGDVDLGYPLVTRFTGYNDADYTSDYKTFSVLYVVPDLAHKRAQKAVLQGNCMPDNSGSIEFKRDLTSAGETITHSINFGGVSQVNESVRQLGTRMLKTLHVTEPDLIPAFVEQGVEVKDIAATSGYNKSGTPGI